MGIKQATCLCDEIHFSAWTWVLKGLYCSIGKHHVWVSQNIKKQTFITEKGGPQGRSSEFIVLIVLAEVLNEFPESMPSDSQLQ